jgi:3-hydroxyisobutyrate dehydrogenase
LARDQFKPLQLLCNLPILAGTCAGASTNMTPTRRPIGIVGSDGFARAVAERIAATGQRVLLHVAGGAASGAASGAGGGKLAKNIEAAATPTDIGFDCEIVFSFIDDSMAFRDLLLGTAERMGLGAEMNPGAVLVDFGARSPRECQALLAVTGMRGVALVDAAITCNGDVLSAGGAIILVGGYPDAVDTVEASLALLGRVDRTGPLGSAHTAAALVGYMEAAHRVAHEEALSVGRALGLSGETLARVLEGGARQSSAENIVNLARRTGLALKLATDRGVSAEVLDFTGARLAQNSAETG